MLYQSLNSSDFNGFETKNGNCFDGYCQISILTLITMAYPAMDSYLPCQQIFSN